MDDFVTPTIDIIYGLGNIETALHKLASKDLFVKVDSKSKLYWWRESKDRDSSDTLDSRNSKFKIQNSKFKIKFKFAEDLYQKHRSIL